MEQDQDERIQSVTGRTIGLLRPDWNRTLITKPTGQLLGYVAEGSTFEKSGRRVALNEQPGLLLHDEDDDL